MAMQRVEDVVADLVSGDEGRAIVIGDGVVAELVDGAGRESIDGLAGGAADVDAHMNVANTLELLALVHAWAVLIVAADAVWVAQGSVGVVALGEVIDFIFGGQLNHWMKGGLVGVGGGWHGMD